jgi:hypothetical protein
LLAQQFKGLQELAVEALSKQASPPVIGGIKTLFYLNDSLPFHRWEDFRPLYAGDRVVIKGNVYEVLQVERLPSVGDYPAEQRVMVNLVNGVEAEVFAQVSLNIVTEREADAHDQLDLLGLPRVDGVGEVYALSERLKLLAAVVYEE